jgi:magnesium transporter
MAVRVRPLIVLASFTLLGCSEELGPERFPSVMVRGSVRVGDRPLGGGFISLVPAEGSRGNVRVAPIRPDGTFEADGVAVGRVIVRIDQVPVESIPTTSGPIPVVILERMLFDSPIRRTIPEGRDASLPIDLIEEANRVIRGPRKSRRRRTRSSRKPESKNPEENRLAENGSLDPAATRPVPLVRVVYREGSGAIHLDWPDTEIERAIGDPGGTVWVDIQDLESACNDSVETLLRDVFHFHTLAIEDALKDTHVPKIDDWNTYLYIVVDTLDFEPETEEVRLHELDLFLGKNYLVTYHNEVTDVLERHRRNLERDPDGRLRSGPSHLLYRLLDEVVAEFLPAIEHLDNLIDDAQDEVFDVPTPHTLRKIFRVKRNALKLHRVVLPMREVLNRLARDPYAQVDADNRIYFRDVYDHLVRIHDIIESLRDLIAGALDTYLSVVSNRTNDIMKALTVVNVMFLPLTFVAGFFGMNFFGETLMLVWPPLPNATLFWLTIALMIGSPIAMTIMARRRGWF